jgi:hypothetical protein
MEHNKAPGITLLPIEFYQHFWETVKHDMLRMFEDLSLGEPLLFSLNFGVITLIPKVQEANLIQQYKPICLLNDIFRIFTKAANSRLNLVVDNVISPSQMAFMRGRNILEGVVMLHESVHDLHKKNLDGIFLKIDFEKAYDKVK